MPVSVFAHNFSMGMRHGDDEPNLMAANWTSASAPEELGNYILGIHPHIDKHIHQFCLGPWCCRGRCNLTWHCMPGMHRNHPTEKVSAPLPNLSIVQELGAPEAQNSRSRCSCQRSGNHIHRSCPNRLLRHGHCNQHSDRTPHTQRRKLQWIGCAPETQHA